MATINDVARAAGVSAATVSRVFNGGRVTAELAERVLRSAAELRFAPNRVARALRMQRSSVISLIIPDIENPYFTALARGVEDAVQGKNHSVVLCNSDEDLDKERRYLVRDLIRYGDCGPEGGRDAMNDLLAMDEPPDAVFVTNDLMAAGVLKALRAADKQPPRTGVLSFGDVPWASLVEPSLSTVEPPSYDLGRTAVGLLLERIAGKDRPHQTVVLQTALQVRSSSTGPSPRR
ncbi:LacI family DNA-binding transcriptional regulator [Streptomyces sp. NPDC017254]|uniref:LacI family DNA-binding transcriptional regulator n=1 Tax=unclassified Streptomyces TaxID=2593676 RepID=UPI0037AAB205